MSMFRTFQTMKACNITVVFVAIGLLICFGLYLSQFIFYYNPIWKWYAIVFQLIFFVLLYWSFIKVYFSQPGSVPKYYALNSSSYKQTDQRRYCLTCHNFKAQRTHHCSACQKCILNMDHHCPWINNCIGFYNRKFFILFLFYLTINLLLVLPQQCYFIVKQLIPILKQQTSTSIHTGIRILLFIFELVLIFPISTFSFYHLSLVLKNQTTLSQMKRQRDQSKNIAPSLNVYDIGSYKNFIQVFGKKTWQWFLPITGTLTCDGLNWPKNSKNYTD